MSINRELSQLASFIDVQEGNNFIGISTGGTYTVGIGTSSVTISPNGTVTANSFVGEGGNSLMDHIDLQDEGSPVGSGFTTLNFVGTGVTITEGASGIATVTITGSEILGTAGEIEATDNGDGTTTLSLADEVGITSSLTVGTVKIESGIVTATSGIVTYNGDGSQLIDIPTSALVGLATDADKLDGQQGSYYLDYSNFSGIATDSDKLDGQEGTYYLDYANFSGIATDSDKLDGQEGTYYLDYSNFTNTPPDIRWFGTAVGIWTSSSVGIGTTNATSTLTVDGTLNVSGISTLGTVKISSGIVTATSGVVTYYGDGTNLTLTNSVALGGDTTGDYVESISGTANQIEVTGGTGEGSTPVISIPNNPTLPGTTVTIQNDLQVNRDLNVIGNITVGGTSGTLFTETLQVADADLILGVRTDANGNDVSTDTTASHGGIAIASTEGTPLITLVNPGAGETLPSTYKKIMWFEQGAFTGLGTDAWLINYGVGIGSTQVPNNVVLAAGDVHITNNDIKKVRDINATGIITAGSFVKASNSGGFLKADGTEDTNNYLTSFTETNDLSSAVTWANVPDANITESSVTQHQAALSITESQISDLQSYLTSADGGDAATVGGISSTSFLRSDAEDTKTFGNLLFSNNVKLRLGSGGDLNLYHNGGESIIENDTGSGDLFIKALQEDKDVVIQSDDGSSGVATYFRADGSTGESILYHYGSQKLATKSTGIDVTGHTETDTLNVSGVSTFQDKVGIGITTSPRVNLALPTKSSFSFTDGLIGAGSQGDYDLTVVDNANQQYVRQYTTNNYTVSVGATKAFRISRSGGSTTASSAPGGMLDNQVAFVVNPNTSTELRYDYDKKLETTGYGVTITGGINVSGVSTFQSHVKLGDNSNLKIGAGDDLEIYHNSITNESIIKETGGSNFLIQGTNLHLQSASGEDYFVGTLDGSAALYCDDVKKFETTGYGVTITGGINVSGVATATDFNSASDENLKTNIRTIEDPLAKVVQIRGVNFDWKETQRPALGVIAQEVEKVLPELVTDNGTKTVNYNGLIGLLIETVKEQQRQIDTLSERLSKLE